LEARGTELVAEARGVVAALTARKTETQEAVRAQNGAPEDLGFGVGGKNLRRAAEVLPSGWKTEVEWRLQPEWGEPPSGAFPREVPGMSREGRTAAEAHWSVARSCSEVAPDCFQGKVDDFRGEMLAAGHKKEVGRQQEAGILDLGQPLVAEGQAHLQQFSWLDHISLLAIFQKF
jgi:hypothetical protein